MMATSTQVPAVAAEHFEAIYAEAGGDASRIPWVRGRANRALVNWLNVVAPSLIRCGSRVAVVACALGDDARELIQRGYDVVAFDCAESAVAWAKRLDPMNAGAYYVADVFDLPSRWRHRFDLVVEVDTLETMSRARRQAAVKCLADLLGRRGHLLVIGRAASEPMDDGDGPPYAMTEQEILEDARAAGLAVSGGVSVFEDDDEPGMKRLRVVLTR